MKNQILIVEDQSNIINLLEDYFQTSEFTDLVRYHEPIIILLNLTLSDKDLNIICREVRQFSSVPIIMITARLDRIISLEIGADDYICKPFKLHKSVACAKAIFRRLDPLLNDQKNKKLPLFIDEEKYIVNFNQIQLDLTPIEFRLVNFLHNMPGRVFSREQLMNALYEDYRIITDRTIDSHVRNIRKKFHNAGSTDEIIHSVYGIGYKYELRG